MVVLRQWWRAAGRRAPSSVAAGGAGEGAAADRLQTKRSRRTIHSTSEGSHHPGYSKSVEALRREEYPHMNKGIYLDHGGATIYPRSAVESFARKLTTGLYGNPHSENGPAKLAGEMVDSVRARALEFLGADPEHFDLVFVANATAAIKLVADAFRDLAEGTSSGSFWYGYHKDAHTSLVGVRELTADHHCFERDTDLSAWLDDPRSLRPAAASAAAAARHPGSLGLLSYPGQSNLSGRRLPLAWPGRLRRQPGLRNTYSLLDAAALAMTAPLRPVFADPAAAPDFACLSFYKIFGFPDLGGLVVRRDSGHVLTLRRYFGGGTVAMVGAVGGAAWHRSKAEPGAGEPLHGALEDGTVPFHSILALGEAMDAHARLFGSMRAVSEHTTRLARRLYDGVAALRHPDGRPACRVYGAEPGAGPPAFGDPQRQGATLAFNLLRPDGAYVPYAEVERVADEHGIYVRSGGICCPGGLFTALQYEPWELERARSAGHSCGSEGLSLVHGLPTGVVRASLGAMSTRHDVDAFVAFLDEVFVSGRARSGGLRDERLKAVAVA